MGKQRGHPDAYELDGIGVSTLALSGERDLKAGTLRHEVTIQQKSVTRDAYGAEVITWTVLENVWASIEPISGREYFMSQQTQSVVDTKITIRYLSGIHPYDRVLYGTRIYDIQTIINPNEKNESLTLMCREFVQ